MGEYVLKIYYTLILGFNGWVFKFLGLNTKGVTLIDFGARLYNLKCIKIGSRFRSGNSLRLQAIYKHSSIIIGDNVTFNDRVHIACAQKVEIKDNCLFASNILITDHGHGLKPKGIPPANRELEVSPIMIEENVWIGENVVIYKGVTIGKGAIIGANSFVNKNIGENEIFIGSPAKNIYGS